MALSIAGGGAAAAAPTAADAPDCSAVSYDGAGTVADPFEVSTLEELQCIGSGDTASTPSDQYVLTDDIDAAETADWNQNETFTEDVYSAEVGERFYLQRTPVVEIVDSEGVALDIVDAEAGIVEAQENSSSFDLTYRIDEQQPTGFNPLSLTDGQFNGNGHTIHGLTVDRPTENHVGLFGTVENGSIRNVTVTDVEITATQYAGGLVGTFRDSGTIRNVHVEGSIEARPARAVNGQETGGVIGIVREGNVTRASANVSVRGRETIGGLVGENRGVINRSWADGDIRANVAHPKSEELRSSAGGLVGMNNGGSVTDSYAQADISETESRVGGLVGWNREVFDDRAVIKRSYATGNVSGTSDTSIGGIGGLVGESDGYSIIEGSYATGTVRGPADRGALVGALDGGLTDPENDVILRTAYWNRDTSGLTTAVGARSDDGVVVEQVEGLSTDAMVGDTAASEMDALDFNGTWETSADPDDYPALRWEAATEAADYADIGSGQVDTGGLHAAVEDWRAGEIDAALLASVIDAWARGATLR